MISCGASAAFDISEQAILGLHDLTQELPSAPRDLHSH